MRPEILAKADDRVLFADNETYDATRITVEAIDNMSNPMPFIQECVEVKLDLLGTDDRKNGHCQD